jgi:hypothetical protein
MGLMDLLLNEPSTMDKVLGILSTTGASGPQASAGQTMPGSAGGTSIFGTNDLNDQSAHDLALRIARFATNKGFDVGELNGWQGQGPIDSGHATNSQHYGLGYAGDVNYYGDGRWRGEPQALNWLDNRLQHRFGDDLTELLWQVPDHYDHLHYGTRPGG